MIYRTSNNNRQSFVFFKKVFKQFCAYTLSTHNSSFSEFSTQQLSKTLLVFNLQHRCFFPSYPAFSWSLHMFGTCQDRFWLLHEVIQTVPEKRWTFIIKGITLHYYVRTYNIIHILMYSRHETVYIYTILLPIIKGGMVKL